MQIIADHQAIDSNSIQDFVHANDLNTLLKQYAAKIKVLSLDCFDTLLWRKTALPIDLFYDLQHYPTYKLLGITPIQRATAEMLARQIMFVKQGTYEIYLKDIYQLGFPHLNQEQVHALVEEELMAEINTCYALPSMVELIRQAHALNIKIIIVSSTYLAEQQLKKLLASVLPEDAMLAISDAFCSCEFGQSKGGGLYGQVVKKLGIRPQSILHIGDNFTADLQAPRAIGMQALHFIPYDSKTNELIRMQNIAAGISLPKIRQERSMSSPFRGVIASSYISTHLPESLLGYISLGPIMYSFARLICDDVEKMKQEGKNPKVLFLMRDGYLPSLACNTLSGQNFGKQARISRFTATAAAFRNKTEVERFLGEYLSILPLDYICRQLLLTPEMTNDFIRIANSEKHPPFVLCKLVLQEKILQHIFEQSALFRARLKRYLHDVLDVRSGDTLIFADIGYVGTAQQLLAPVLKDELGIEMLCGRYLMTLNTADWQSARRGLIDPSWCDDRIMTMLSSDVSLIEEFCCSGDDSVVDYDQNGNPVFHKTSINKEQLSKIKRIQTECVRFVQDAKNFFQNAKINFPLDKLRDAALVELTRLLYLPTETEIDFLRGFYHDKNKGYQETYRIYSEPKQELNQLRRHGMLFRNQHPHMLRSANIELSLALMAQRRYGFEVILDDRSLRQEWISIIIMQDKKPIPHTCNASLTYDGYFALCIPIDMSYTQIAILFGKNYQTLQIESVEMIKTHAFLSVSEESKNSTDLLTHSVFNQIIDRGNNLIECSSPSSALIANLPTREGPHIFRIIYRPIINR